MRDILLVEDNLGDVVLFRAALAAAKVEYHLHVAVDGIEAVGYLRDSAKAKDPSLPDVIVLDLNLPRMNGSEVIEQIHSDRLLRLIPLVILTSSPNDQGVLKEWDRNRCLYLVKTSGFHGLIDLVRTIEAFLSAVPGQETVSA